MADEENISKEEKIGFHKGALSTLVKEREEMLKIINIVEQLMKYHIEELQKLGVDLTKVQNQGKKENLDEKLK